MSKKADPYSLFATHLDSSHARMGGKKKTWQEKMFCTRRHTAREVLGLKLKPLNIKAMT